MSLSFLEQFHKHRESQVPALVCGNASLTYAEFYKRCLTLASKLRQRGIGLNSTEPEQYNIFEPKAAKYSPWVVIVTDHCSVNAAIGVVAAHMAGGAYVLAEKSAPESYINNIIEDTAATVVLRDEDFELNGENCDFNYTFPKENEIACAIFTSGSMGKPKGAVLEHRSINRMIRWQTEYMKSAKHAATAAYAQFSFIAAIWEIFYPLANGFTLHILKDDVRHDLFSLERYINDNNISYIFLPPNVAETFTQTYKGKALKYLRIAGGRLRSCGAPAGYEIMYNLGMSENGGSVTFKSINAAMNGDISIGKAWNGTKIELDAQTGEMIVSGPSLFRGYLNRRDETEMRLINGKYYSGDLARIDENGEIIHLGRKDSEIKIRDTRVNPAQVENVLSACAGVAECCVTAQELGGGNILIGWVAGITKAEALKAELSSRLPDYMVPSVFVIIEKFPRNVNGKIDKTALVYTPPKSENAANDGMPALFERILGRSAGDDDNFFALGGDSLKLMRLQAEIAREYSKNIPYAVLFKNPTPRMINAILHEGGGNADLPIPEAELMDMYPLSAPMRQMWLLWRTGQDGGKYTVFIQCDFKGEIDKSRAVTAFTELTRRNAILRSRFVERNDEAFQVIEESVDVAFSDKPRREFDLLRAPIFDITLTENSLRFTTHHIIADAIGEQNLMEDFWALYCGNEPSKSVQVHDASVWSLSRDASSDENYWLQMYSDKALMRALPCDFAPPGTLAYSVDETLAFNEDETERLREYAVSHGTTLFQLFLTAYALMLSRIFGSGSVIIGVPFSGREHPSMARTIGMFIRTLPLRLDVSGMNFSDALSHTRERMADAWEHQNVSLERLATILKLPRTESGNLFYDVMMNYVPKPRILPEAGGLSPKIIRSKYSGAIFDLIFDLFEEENGVLAVFKYAAELFEPETVKQWMETFKMIVFCEEERL